MSQEFEYNSREGRPSGAGRQDRPVANPKFNFARRGQSPYSFSRAREFDSVFTRKIVEEKEVILPVWCGVSVEEEYDYSPILADKVSVDWGRERHWCMNRRKRAR